jgi:hypothetical protein
MPVGLPLLKPLIFRGLRSLYRVIWRTTRAIRSSNEEVPESTVDNELDYRRPEFPSYLGRLCDNDVEIDLA